MENFQLKIAQLSMASYFFYANKIPILPLSDEIMLRKLENNDSDNDNRKNQ